MRKRNLIFPLVVSSLFIPSIEALESTTEFNSLENENYLYEAVDILIAEGSGGGGEKASDKKANDLKKAIKSYDFFIGKRKEAIAKGESTTEIDKKIKKYEKKILELNPNFFGGGPNSLPKEPETKDAEPKEKIAISKLDTDLGVGLDYIKNETKELTAKIAISSISNISAKILELKDEFKNYNPRDINDFLKKVDEIESKIDALEELQDKIDDFLNFNIEM